MIYCRVELFVLYGSSSVGIEPRIFRLRAQVLHILNKSHGTALYSLLSSNSYVIRRQPKNRSNPLYSSTPFPLITISNRKTSESPEKCQNENSPPSLHRYIKLPNGKCSSISFGEGNAKEKKHIPVSDAVNHRRVLIVKRP